MKTKAKPCPNKGRKASPGPTKVYLEQTLIHRESGTFLGEQELVVNLDKNFSAVMLACYARDMELAFLEETIAVTSELSDKPFAPVSKPIKPTSKHKGSFPLQHRGTCSYCYRTVDRKLLAEAYLRYGRDKFYSYSKPVCLDCRKYLRGRYKLAK